MFLTQLFYQIILFTHSRNFWLLPCMFVPATSISAARTNQFFFVRCHTSWNIKCLSLYTFKRYLGGSIVHGANLVQQWNIICVQFARLLFTSTFLTTVASFAFALLTLIPFFLYIYIWECKLVPVSKLHVCYCSPIYSDILLYWSILRNRVILLSQPMFRPGSSKSQLNKWQKKRLE